MVFSAGKSPKIDSSSSHLIEPDLNINPTIVSGIKGHYRTPVSDYQEWHQSFWNMGWEGLGQRAKIGIGLKLTTELAISPFVQSAVRGLNLSGNFVPTLLVAGGISLLMTGVMVAYDYSNSTGDLKDLNNSETQIYWLKTFAERWAYSFVGASLGMLGGQFALKTLSPGTSLLKKYLVGAGIDFLSEPVLQAPGAVLVSYTMGSLGFKQSDMTITERLKMETMEGLLGTALNHTSSSALYHGAMHISPIGSKMEGMRNGAMSLGHIGGSAVGLAVRGKSNVPPILYHGTCHAFDDFVTDGSLSGDLGAHFGSRYVASAFTGTKVDYSPQVLSRFLAEHPDLPLVVRTELENVIQRTGGATNDVPHRLCAVSGWSAVIRLDEMGFSKHADTLAGLAKYSVAKESGRVIPVRLLIKAPLRMPDMGIWTVEGILSALLENTYDQAIFARMPDPDKNHFHAGQTRIGQDVHAKKLLERIRSSSVSLAEQASKLSDVLRKAGYDSFVYKNAAEGDADSWMVLSPDKIRSGM